MQSGPIQSVDCLFGGLIRGHNHKSNPSRLAGCSRCQQLDIRDEAMPLEEFLERPSGYVTGQVSNM